MKNARCFWMLLIGLAIGNAGSRADEASASKPWAVQPIRAIEPPADPSGWSANAVDRFIRAKQRDHQLEPADPTDKRTLLRRVTLDVLGLPPTPEEIEAWSDSMDKRRPTPEDREKFDQYLAECGPNRSDIQRWPDLLDLDDFVSYGGKA